MLLLARLAAWMVALGWVYRMAEAARGIPTIPDLLRLPPDSLPAGSPSVTVIVPARNEAANVRACLESLLAQDYPRVQVIAVDDRSTDATGAVMESLRCDQLRVLHIAELPPEWLGKTHAMATAAALAPDTDFLLFTDADILFRPDALRLALASAAATGADHLVLAPTMIIRRWDEAAMVTFIQVFSIWAARPWKASDKKALRDAIGIGAFNLVRTSAYGQIGGFEALRMEIVEDLGLARRIKLAGLAQRFVFGHGLVSVHWASGVDGIVNGLTKNMFSVFRYNLWLLLAACVWLAMFCLAPFVLVWSRPFTAPAAVTIAAICAGYWVMSRRSNLSAWNAPLAPFAAGLFLYALLKSMVATFRQGGVVWRGTLYPLAELRKHTPPLFPRRG